MVTRRGLPDRLSNLRAKSGLSARELSRLAGLGEAHVALIEGGSDNPTIKTVEGLASVLGTTVGWLVAGEGRAPTSKDVREAVERARSKASGSGEHPAVSVPPTGTHSR